MEVVENGETRTVGLRLLDRVDLNANRWLVASQFVVQGERDVIRPDVVAFVNGLPLAVLELKSPVAEHATLETAYNQLQNYKNKASELFAPTVLVISDGLHARVGSLTAGLDRFTPWQTIDGDKHDDEEAPRTRGDDPWRIRARAISGSDRRLRRI